MKCILTIVCLVFYFSLSAQVQLPKLESSLTIVQQEEYKQITECLVKINYRMEGTKYSLPIFKDENDDLFCVIMKNGHVELVSTDQFDYAQN